MSAQQYACSCTTQAVPLLLLPLHGAPFAELAFGRLAVVRLSCHFICNVTEYRGMLHFIACRTLVYVARGGGGLLCAKPPPHLLLPLHTCGYDCRCELQQCGCEACDRTAYQDTEKEKKTKNWRSTYVDAGVFVSLVAVQL